MSIIRSKKDKKRPVPEELAPDSLVAPKPGRYLGRRTSFWQPAVLVGVLLVGSVLAYFVYHSHAATGTNIAINGSSAGSTFDGVGAISGGGGDSRFLADYPATQRAQIMNYLFAPNYGASLQLLKVEIGGDTDSTDGAEPSIEHSRGAIDCNSGYEWNIMEQAKALNPSIKFYGLAWGAPGWIGGGNFWSQDMITYITSWLNCAQQHNVAVSYIGGWNEKGYNEAWFENLRTALNSAGMSGVQIVASDGASGSAWKIAPDVNSNTTLRNAIGILGDHDTCGYPTTGTTCTSSAAAKSSGKPLWASELGAMDGNAGAPDMVRAMNRGYIDADLTGFLTWPMMESMPPGLPHPGFGLITANQPWTGNYSANNMIWAIAHTAQFTKPGWQYLNSGSGYLGGNRANGSYVTLKSTDNVNWSMIAETTSASSAQSITATISGGLSGGAVHVWATNLNSSNPASWFQKLGDIAPNGANFSYTLQPGYVYSFTTTTGQGKGNAGNAPGAVNFPLPYSDALNDPDSSNEAKYLAAMDGAFEGAPCAGGVGGTCLEQMTPADPINWEATAAFPYAIIGDTGWVNYTISVNTLFTQANTSGGVMGRFSNFTGPNNNEFDGYLLHVTTAGAWKILRNNLSGAPATLASGTVAAFNTNTWHNLSLTMNGSQISAAIDGKAVGSVSDGAYASGLGGIEAGAFTGTWPVVQYRSLVVTQPGGGGGAPAPTPTPGGGGGGGATPTPTSSGSGGSGGSGGSDGSGGAGGQTPIISSNGTTISGSQPVVSGTISFGHGSSGGEIIVRVDGVIVSTNGVLNTSKLTNGRHVVTITQNGVTTTRIIYVKNHLSPWQTLRNTLVAAFHGDKSSIGKVLLGLLAVAAVAWAGLLAVPVYRKVAIVLRGRKPLPPTT